MGRAFRAQIGCLQHELARQCIKPALIGTKMTEGDIKCCLEGRRKLSPSMLSGQCMLGSSLEATC